MLTCENAWTFQSKSKIQEHPGKSWIGWNHTLSGWVGWSFLYAHHEHDAKQHGYLLAGIEVLPVIILLRAC